MQEGVRLLLFSVCIKKSFICMFNTTFSLLNYAFCKKELYWYLHGIKFMTPDGVNVTYTFVIIKNLRIANKCPLAFKMVLSLLLRSFLKIVLMVIYFSSGLAISFFLCISHEDNKQQLLLIMS